MSGTGAIVLFSASAAAGVFAWLSREATPVYHSIKRWWGGKAEWERVWNDYKAARREIIKNVNSNNAAVKYVEKKDGNTIEFRRSATGKLDAYENGEPFIINGVMTGHEFFDMRDEPVHVTSLKLRNGTMYVVTEYTTAYKAVRREIIKNVNSSVVMGSRWRVKEKGVHAENGVMVFESMSSWSRAKDGEGNKVPLLRTGTVVTSAGQPQVVEGYEMLPISYPVQGAVECRFLERVPDIAELGRVVPRPVNSNNAAVKYVDTDGGTIEFRRRATGKLDAYENGEQFIINGVWVVGEFVDEFRSYEENDEPVHVTSHKLRNGTIYIDSTQSFSMKPMSRTDAERVLALSSGNLQGNDERLLLLQELRDEFKVMHPHWRDRFN
jgi:hypothetical protein